MFGCSKGISLRGVHHDDALFRRSPNIHVIHPYTRSADHLQIVRFFDDVPSHLCCAPHNESVVPANDVSKLFLLEVGFYVHGKIVGPQDVNGLVGHCVCDEDIHGTSLCRFLRHLVAQKTNDNQVHCHNITINN